MIKAEAASPEWGTYIIDKHIELLFKTAHAVHKEGNLFGAPYFCHRVQLGEVYLPKGWSVRSGFAKKSIWDIVCRPLLPFSRPEACRLSSSPEACNALCSWFASSGGCCDSAAGGRVRRCRGASYALFYLAGRTEGCGARGAP